MLTQAAEEQCKNHPWRHHPISGPHRGQRAARRVPLGPHPSPAVGVEQEQESVGHFDMLILFLNPYHMLPRVVLQGDSDSLGVGLG